MASSALLDFKANIAAANALIALEAPFRDPPPAGDLPQVQGLRGGSVVLLVAAFEGHVRACIAEHLERLATDPPPVPFGELPQAMRIASVFDGLKDALERDKEGKRSERLPYLIRAADRVASGRIVVGTLSDTRSNPDSKRLDALLKRIGIEKPLEALRPPFEAGWGTVVAQTFIANRLDEIVGKRHVVAHTATTLNVTKAELPEYSRFIELLGDVVDQLVEAHVDGILAGAP